MSEQTNQTRRDFVKTLGAGAMAVPMLSMVNAQAQNGKKPNIIWIMADDLGYGDVGCYGQQVIQTPNIDRLAKEGMRFTDAYAGSTVCAPSRSCLMTGLHTGHTRVRGNKRHPLLPEDLTVAELLKEAGYTTGLIGKWGLGEPDTTGVPNRKGFDYFFGYLNQHRAHNYYPDFLWRNEERWFMPRWTYSHDLFTDEALKFVDDHQEEPFFLYLAYTIPHAFNEGGSQGMQVPSDEPYSDEDWPQQSKNHAAMITRMDTDIGKLMDKLKEIGVDENTIIFFTSDNGPHREGGADPDFFDSNGPLRGIKRALYDGGIRVPMIARWPGKIEAGSVSDFAWAFWDFLPTAAELAGSESPDDIDGISIVPTLMGEEQQSHDYLYWEFHERGFSQAIRKDHWKAVKNGKEQPIELYDIKKDIAEQNNVAENHPEIVEEMKTLFAEARTENPEYPI